MTPLLALVLALASLVPVQAAAVHAPAARVGAVQRYVWPDDDPHRWTCGTHTVFIDDAHPGWARAAVEYVATLDGIAQVQWWEIVDHPVGADVVVRFDESRSRSSTTLWPVPGKPLIDRAEVAMNAHANVSPKAQDLRDLLHEFGHVFGLGHQERATSIMGFGDNGHVTATAPDEEDRENLADLGCALG